MGAYNAEQYLADVMKSLLEQTFPDFELIVVDDGSTDRSSEILEEYARRDSRVYVLTQENQGLGRALNNGLERASGKYIVRADADDFSYPRRLECQVVFMEARPGVVASGTGVMLVDPLGIPISQLSVFSDHDAIETELLQGNGSAICHPSVILRRDALLQIGGYDPTWRVTEDLDLFLRLARVGQLANLPDILLDWRQHLGSTNHSKRERQLNEVREILKAAHEIRGLDFDPRTMKNRPDVPVGQRLLRWGWNALNKGYRKAALRYAMKSLQSAPLSLQTYKLLACIARGR